MRCVLVMLLGLVLGGCSPAGPRVFTFEASSYPAVFDAAREEIRGARFELNRVDARNGVISTELKETGGLATPRDFEQQSLGQEWQDLLNDQLREVRVWFRPVGEEPAREADEVDPGADLRAMASGGGEIEATVEVILHRRRQPGWQVETESIRRSGKYTTPEFGRRQMYAGSTTPIRRDDDFARELARRIVERAGVVEN
jgi:predicted  nucleic acid-binding Zn-ribbon protein